MASDNQPLRLLVRIIVPIYLLLAVSCTGMTGHRPEMPELATGPVEVFERSPAELVSAFSRIPVERDYSHQTLAMEVLMHYRADGVLERQIRSVIRINTQEGVERFSLLNLEWQPWRQEKPEIYARVVSPSGQESRLDPATIVEVGSRPGNDQLRTDARTLTAALPHLTTDSILEYRVVERMMEARSGGGIAGTFRIGGDAPMESLVIRIHHPRDMRVTWRLRGATGNQEKITDQNGSIGMQWSFSRLPAQSRLETMLPYDEAPVPLLSYGNAKDWSSVARAYATAIDSILEPGLVSAWARSITGTIDSSKDPRSAALALADAVRTGVRYTGILFGENSIIPRNPSEILSTGYGDCKDQAALLVAALRSQGIESYMALLRSGFSTDLDTTVPGLEFFDHAVVHAPALGLWFDPTALYARPGSLPAADEGRLALLIRPGEENLVMIPMGERPWYRELREVQLSSSGAAELVVETTRAGGSAEQQLRANYASQPISQSLAHLRQYGEKAHEARKTVAAIGTVDDLSTPFQVQVTMHGSVQGWTDVTRAVFGLKAGPLFDPLPALLKPSPRSGQQQKRKGDVFLATVPISELGYKVIAPPGHRAVGLPESRVIQLGPARLIFSCSSPDETTVLATYRLEFPTDRLSASEYESYIASLTQFLDSRAEYVVFSNIGQELMENGKLREALEEFRSLAETYPESPIYLLQAAETLLQAGFPEDAIHEAEAAIALDPSNAQAHRYLGFILMHDHFGKQYGKGADLPRAAEEFLAAYTMDTDQVASLFIHAGLLQYGKDGVHRGPDARLDEALAAYRLRLNEIEAMDKVESYLDLMYHMGNFGGILDYSRSLKDARKGGSFMLAGSAIQDGVPAALTLAASTWQDLTERRSMLASAAFNLISARKYKQASELLLASARGTSQFAAVSEFSRVLASITPSLILPEAEARRNPKDFVITLMRILIQEKRMPWELVSPGHRVDQDEELAFSVFHTIDETLSSLGFGNESLADIIQAVIEVRSVAVGPVVFATVGMPALGLDQFSGFLLAEEEKGLYLLGDSPDEELGGMILELFDSGRFEDSRRLMRAALSPASVLPGFPTPPNRSRTLLINPDSLAPADVIISSAALGGWQYSPSLAARLAGPCLEVLQKESNTDRKIALFSLTLDLASFLKDEVLLEQVLQVAEAVDAEADTFLRLSGALYGQGRYKDAERLLRKGLLKDPGHDAMIRLQARLAAELGRPDEFYALHGQLITAGKGNPTDVNNQAWAALFLDEVELAKLLRPGFIRMLEDGGASSAHTTVCFMAALGRYEEARASFGKLLDMEEELGEAAMWTAHGYLALSFGLRDRALQSFRKAAVGDGSPIKSAALARVMLERLGGD